MIGCDIIEISRIKDSIERFGDKFLDRILTKDEKKLYLSRNRPCSFVAGRFAAKEAVSKAMGSGISDGLSFTDIEILPDEKGKPILRIFKEIKYGADVSISHSNDNAMAVCIINIE